MTRRIVLLDIPAPCKWINSNDRLHRMKAAQLTAIWRNAGTVAVLDQIGRPVVAFSGKVHITAKVWKKRKGRYDVLNLWPSLKAAIDGIVAAGLLRDDDFDTIIGPDMRHGGFGEPRLIITIEEIQ